MCYWMVPGIAFDINVMSVSTFVFDGTEPNRHLREATFLASRINCSFKVLRNPSLPKIAIFSP